MSALTDCSIILYVMTEKWFGGKKYRDLFEVIKNSVLNAMSEGKHIPGAALSSMKDDMQSTLQGLQVLPIVKNIPDDLEQMISDMAGEPMFWDNTDLVFDTAGGDSEQMLQSAGGINWDVPGQELWLSDGDIYESLAASI